ncbi:TPA: hypothetical protein L9M61_005398 [Klebsiella pneumoniae]|uniref:hypothetical protein n=1 Tax=Klebsiella pneumoniae TaxID=573 RepID=UPI0020CE6035|nr:hypothetical protein [Klebsiella pneumoniae]MCQ0749162.1 hypothetical protein [Klebsiella pneumoniae]HBR1869614.1 hypothetical protein [Klebsiella pneumoniae]
MSEEKNYGQGPLIPVFAIKIESVTNVANGQATITPEPGQEITDPITVTAAFMEKFKPQPGGYYIMCEGGVGLYASD